ncbi:MAG TPA: DUF1667 domain-containing protein [Treponemataceae bacterium]|nr:DUF1667 domain-containing protein [Treponemataceae bacterium]
MTDLPVTEEQMTCIICPMGCSMEVRIEHDGLEKRVLSVRDNGCPRGEQYAFKEVRHPTRTLTTTVAVKNGEAPLVPVKTSAEIPKQLLFNAMEILRRIVVDAPVSCGQIIIKDLLGTSVAVTACADVEKK